MIVGARTRGTDLEDERGEDALDLGLEARKGLLGGPEGSVTALVERVGDEIVKDGACLFGDAPRLGEDVVEHVIDVHAMVVQRVFVRVSGKGGCQRFRGKPGPSDVRIREPEAPKELRDVRFDLGDVDHGFTLPDAVQACNIVQQVTLTGTWCSTCPQRSAHSTPKA